MDDFHKEVLNGLHPAQVYFNLQNKYPATKGNGKCIIDNKPTTFNITTERYDRLCSDECREKYRKQFAERMMSRYGKTSLTDEPDQQNKMLAARKISGIYKWKNGIDETKYVGTYEKDFLEFLDLLMNWDDPSDIISPSPVVISYEFEGKPHFYIPDFYITSLNMIVEVKSEDNKHYRARDLEQEKAKDMALINTKEYVFFKIYDKKYAEFFQYVLDNKNKI
jgi:hypothetical protein